MIKIVLDKETYCDLASQETNFFWVKNSTKIKSKFGSNTPPEAITVANGYGKNARNFTAAVKMHFPSDNLYCIQIGTPQIPPEPLNFEKTARTIADGLGMKGDAYDIKKNKLRTDNQLLVRKVADLFDVDIKIQDKWLKNPYRFFKYIVKKI